jgi:ATP-dependent DNA helicase RecG
MNLDQVCVIPINIRKCIPEVHLFSRRGIFFVTTIPLTNVADVKIGPKKNVGQGVGQGVGQEENLEDKILQMIAENNKVTKKEIAQALGVSEKTIERHMKDMDNIEYVGRGYSGYWHIKE